MLSKLSGLLLTSALAFGTLAGSAKQADIDLQAAIRTETVSGDLRSAIKQYESIVAKYGKTDRTIGATALVHMAECYQKLGDVSSHKIYEQVLREYGDQAEAVAAARTRLARANVVVAGGGMTSRRIWTTPPPSGWDFITGATISPDGRLLSYTDWVTGYVAVHEFATGRDRYLTNSGYPNWAEQSAISRDGKQLAYSWFNEKNRYELRVTSLEGDLLPPSRLLFDNEDIDWLMPCDWAPDNNWIAVQLTRKDRSFQMGLISVRDGSLRVLKSLERPGALELFFSPDGNYLGFDFPLGGNREQRDVFTLAVDGSRQMTVAAGRSNDTMMGWSPDGKYLLFASDRGGAIGLWAVPVANGRPQGAPELIKPDISRFSLGVSAAGSLYSGVESGDRDVRVASVDFESGKLLSEPTRPIQSFVGTNSDPGWSGDGKYLAYRSQRNHVGRNDVLGILSLETGQVRELQPELSHFQNPRWMPDGQSLIVGGKDFKGGPFGQYQVDLQTGEVKPFTTPVPGVSRDGKRSYFRKNLGTDGFSFVERDLASGKEREIIRRKGLGNLSLSPDGQFIGTTDTDESKKPQLSTVLLIPISDGQPRELLRVKQPQSLQIASWMADGTAVLVGKALNESGNHAELLLVPVANGQPRKIDIGANQFIGAVKVHPDGRQIAYVAGERKQEAWVLENFIPALNTKK